MTLARSIGDAVREARRTHADPVAAVLSFGDGVILFSGKIVDIERRMVAGFARGSVTIEGLADDRGERLRIEFQNEYLVAERGTEVLAVVPDLICIVDRETAEPVTTEILRYGLRVAVLGMPAPRMLKTPEALAVIGPQAFGYDTPYRPLPGLYGGDVG
jgi:DUF917 family protein